MAEHRQQSRRSFIKRAAVIGGAATFGANGIVAQPGTAMTAVPSHNDRTRGWLRFIWEKQLLPTTGAIGRNWSCPGAFKSRAGILTGMTMASALTPGGTNMQRRPCSVTDGLIWPTQAIRCC